MTITLISRLRLPATLIFATLASAACGEKPAERPAPPQIAAPAPAPTQAPAEDRGHEKGEAASESSDGAFDHVDGGEAERAASQRGHESAGEPLPATQPGSGE